MYKIKRTENEINEALNVCQNQIDKGGSHYPGKTYEEGIYDA